MIWICLVIIEGLICFYVGRLNGIKKERNHWKKYYLKKEIICNYPNACGLRMNGRCDLEKPCDKYIP